MDRAAVVVGKRGGRVDAQHVVERGQDVLRSIGLSCWHGRGAVGGTDDLAHFQSAADEHCTAGLRPMVAAAARIDLGRATKLAPYDDRHIAIEAAVVEVIDERAERLIEQGQERAVAVKDAPLLVAAVVIPQSNLEGYVRHTRFDEPPGANKIREFPAHR